MLLKKIDVKSFACRSLGRYCKYYGVKIQFLSLICALAMCYYAWLNILEFQYKPTDYRLYEQHYMVRSSVIEKQNLNINVQIPPFLHKCQYFGKVDQSETQIINMENKLWKSIGLQMQYTFPSKIAAIMMVLLDFLAFLIGNHSEIWSLRLYIVVWFVDMTYTLICPLVQNINYGKQCIENSPVLDILSVNFLPATSGNLFIMIFVAILIIPALSSVKLAKKNQLGIPCTQEMIQCWTYGLLSFVYSSFFVYCLFFYVTSFWANPALGNIIWLFNTLLDYFSYCILVQQMEQKQDKPQNALTNMMKDIKGKGQQIPQNASQSFFQASEIGLDVDLD